jgi:poly-gamma-glutamate synthesis protein (capsule biosynthesis protein)
MRQGYRHILEPRAQAGAEISNQARWTIAAALAAALLPAAAFPTHSPLNRMPEQQRTQTAVPQPTPEPTPEPAPVRRVSVTVALTGDVLVHDSVWLSARRSAERTRAAAEFDFGPMLASLRPVISGADLAICHMETPVAPVGGPYSSYPLFSVPREVVDGLARVGYDACSTASNHSVDRGFEGVVRTLDALDRAGLAHTGTSRSPAGARKPVIIDVEGIRIGWLSYTYGTNGMPVDADKPWSVNLIEPARILRDARRARAQGADAVLVALHWGDEYSHEPSQFQVSLAKRLTRSPDITMLYGHHAHVTQPIRKVNGKWVVYGLGNLLADQETVAPGVDDGLVAVVTLSQTGDSPARVTKMATVPTHIQRDAPPYGELRVRVGRPRA